MRATRTPFLPTQLPASGRISEEDGTTFVYKNTVFEGDVVLVVKVSVSKVTHDIDYEINYSVGQKDFKVSPEKLADAFVLPHMSVSETADIKAFVAKTIHEARDHSDLWTLADMTKIIFDVKKIEDHNGELMLELTGSCETPEGWIKVIVTHGTSMKRPVAELRYQSCTAYSATHLGDSLFQRIFGLSYTVAMWRIKNAFISDNPIQSLKANLHIDRVL